MPIKSKPDNRVTQKMARQGRLLFTTLLLGAGALVLTRLWWPVHLPGKSGWPEAVLLWLAIIGTVAALARHLPLQNILFAALVIALAVIAIYGQTWHHDFVNYDDDVYVFNIYEVNPISRFNREPSEVTRRFSTFAQKRQ